RTQVPQHSKDAAVFRTGRIQPEFGEDRRDVLFHGTQSNHQPTSDALIVEALRHHLQDLTLAGCQRREWVSPVVEEFAYDLRVKDGSAIRDPSDGVLQLIE